MTEIYKLENLFKDHDLNGKRVILRADFNVPIIGGKIAEFLIVFTF